MVADLLEILETLAEYYRETEKLTEKRLRIYINTLDDLDPAVLEKGAFLWIKEGKQFFPRVSELRAYASRAIRVERSDPDPLGRFWSAMAAFNASLAGALPESILDDRRYARFFQSPKMYEELTPDAREWWDSLPAPAASDVELEKRYPVVEEVSDGT